MTVLLQFLKPLNKSFIRSYNSLYCKNSTPWAKAIKDNMPSVSPDGCFSLKNLQLGEPRYPAPEIFNPTYNPFIDQVHFKYRASGIQPQTESFPYHITSVLGKYASPEGQHEFDIRHLLCMLPDDEFWCSTYDGYEETVYINFWHHGLLFFIYYDTYNEKVYQNPFENISAPAYFEAVPIIKGFNTNIPENLVPVNAITWQYIQRDNKWYLVFTIDFSKTTLKNPANHVLLFWGVGLTNGSSHQSEAKEWDLANSTFESELGPNGFHGSIISLYTITNKHGKQVSRFNRIYIDKGSEGDTYPYFDQLFICNYSCPASFILSGDQCGFCGNIDDMFGELLALYDQRIISNGTDPAPPVEFSLYIDDNPNGTAEVSGLVRAVEEQYIFKGDTKATLTPMPNQGYSFDRWSGDDQAAVVDLSYNTYEILMSKDRRLLPVFKTI